MTFDAMKPSALATLATGRTGSMFQRDYDASLPAIAARLRGARVLVIGGAGSIGGSVTRLLAGIEAAALHVMDSNENGLVELTRDLRAGQASPRAGELRFLPLDFTSTVVRRLINSEAPYDAVLNFAAVKHVRSEKDALSLLRMFDINVLGQLRLLEALARRHPETTYFSVSTDKAANPVNLMGASKRLMEHVMFSAAHRLRGGITSARFANVAFSDGSLLQGWQHRLSKRQPIAVPRDTRRYFVSLEEAGQLCLLAAFCQPHRSILVPRLTPDTDLHLLEDIAADFVRHTGSEPEWYEDEGLARAASEATAGRYPVLLTPLDTSGEKAFEEFAGEGEEALEAGFEALLRVPYRPLALPEPLDALVDEVARLLADPCRPTTKEQLIDLVRQVLPEFAHTASTRQLDDRV